MRKNYLLVYACLFCDKLTRNVVGFISNDKYIHCENNLFD